jgi:hypothetical protein
MNLTFDGLEFKFEENIFHGIIAQPCNVCDVYKVFETHLNYQGKNIEIPEKFRNCYCENKKQPGE